MPKMTEAPINDQIAWMEDELAWRNKSPPHGVKSPEVEAIIATLKEVQIVRIEKTIKRLRYSARRYVSPWWGEQFAKMETELAMLKEVQKNVRNLVD